MDGQARVVRADDKEERPAGGNPLDRLYRAESPRLLRSVARRVANRDEAQDVVQEIFCRVARLSGEGGLRFDKPRAYLSRMAANLLHDRAKAAERRQQERHDAADEDRLAGPDLGRQLEARDMLARVEAAVRKLPDKTRLIFLAHRIDGLSYAEIAEQTGLSIKGVEKQMSKAIARIDRLMDRA